MELIEYKGKQEITVPKNEIITQKNESMEMVVRAHERRRKRPRVSLEEKLLLIVADGLESLAEWFKCKRDKANCKPHGTMTIIMKGDKNYDEGRSVRLPDPADEYFMENHGSRNEMRLGDCYKGNR